ncbi:MAG TPA: GGDEF domain-containing protein [Firmicutes bacterium]|nr:GGDEF domain-containing protein [Bacillota bacterium]
MADVHHSKFYYGAIFFVAAAALTATVEFYDGISWGGWHKLLVFALLISYFHTLPVEFGGRVSYSLGTAVMFPILCLLSTTDAVLLSAIGGLVDGYVGKKPWERILFNVSQFAVSATAGSLVCRRLASGAVPVYPGDIQAIILGGLTYILVNILLVTAIVAIWTKRSWRHQLALFGWNGILVSIGSGFIGLIFSLFVASYGFPGQVLFAVLLVQLAALIRIGAVAKGEREIRRELEHELIIDEMTKVYNFRYLSGWLASAAEETVAALFIDIDDFKLFNDRYGHQEGDRVLKILAETVKKCVRADDRVIRYGGEEFVVLLAGMDSRCAEKVAQRIQDKLRKLPYAKWQQPITVSIGIASSPQDTKDKHQLMLIADQAMYAAKKAGKDTCCIWTKQENPA